MDNPEISVIVLIYQVEQYLRHCLDSLLAQTYSNIEIVCVFKECGDSSREILNEYSKRDARIRLVEQCDSGYSSAMILGVKSSRGIYIMFCDADDWYEPIMCEKMRGAIIDHDADMACCYFYIEGANQSKAKDFGIFQPMWPGKYKKYDKIFMSIDSFVWNKIFKKELMQKYSIPYGKMSFGSDFAYSHEYLVISKSIYVFNEKLCHYTLRPGASSDVQDSNDFAKAGKFDYIRNFELFYDFLIFNDLWEKHKSVFFLYYPAFLRYMWHNLKPCYREGYFDTVRTFLERIGIQNWNSFSTNALMKAIQKRQYKKAALLMSLWPAAHPGLCLRYVFNQIRKKLFLKW